MHFDFTREIPRHAVHERRSPGIFTNDRQILQKFAITKGNAVQAVERSPVPRAMIDAIPLFQPHGAEIGVNYTRVANMDLNAHRLPAANLMVKLRIRASQPARMANHT
jgi:hypothetical protein